MSQIQSAFVEKTYTFLFYHHFSGSTRENGANGQFFRLIYQIVAERRVSSLIGAKRGKTAAQTALRFLMQSGVVVIPKSVHKERMQQNFDLFDFTLTDEDMAQINSLDKGKPFFEHNDEVLAGFLAYVPDVEGQK